LTFGLGYFEDGVWVDHLTADHRSVRERADEASARRDADPIDVVHQWLSCCAEPVDPESLGQNTETPAPAMGTAIRAVAGTAQR
jgi:hypothetical protein